MNVPAPSARAALDDIPAYRAGASATGADGRPLAKLSSNELPHPPTDAVVEAIARAAGRAQLYPDPGYTRLREALARRHGVGPDRVVAGAGSVAVLYHLLQAYCEPGDEVVFAWRSFEAYPIATRLVGAVAVTVPLLEPTSRHDVDAIAAAVTERTRVVLACTPNNPTGPAMTQAELDTLADALPSTVLLVIDEAYAEFASPDPGVAGRGHALLERPNVVSLRTFSKAYALAGLRVGYAVTGAADVADAVGKCALPFGVNHLAQAAALAALDDPAETARRVAEVTAERERVRQALVAAGVPVPASEANFVWVPAGDRTGTLDAACRAGGVVVRPFAGDGVRISIGMPADNDRVIAAVAGWAASTSTG